MDKDWQVEREYKKVINFQIKWASLGYLQRMHSQVHLVVKRGIKVTKYLGKVLRLIQKI
jgi:hypothetical protein